MEFGPLRQQILQLAVSGQLVEQLDSEPAVEQVGPAPKPDEVPFELPAKWKWVQIGAVGQIIGGGTPSSKVLEYWENPEVAWITPADLVATQGAYISSGSRGISQLGLQKSSAKLVPVGTVIYASRATIGALAIATNECCTNQGCKSLIPYEAVITSKWAYYALIYATPAIKNLATGTTFAEISGKKLGSVWIPLPPIKEQDRITAQVDEMLGRLDQMEAAYSEFAGPMAEHFRNLMLDKAIRGELVPQLDSEPEVEQVGPAPKPDEVPFELPPKWKWAKICSVGQVVGGATPKSNIPEYWEHPTVTWITTADLTSATSGYVSDGARGITELGLANCSAKLVPPGSVIYTTRGARIGDLAIATKECCTNQGCKTLVPDTTILTSKWAYYALMHSTPVIRNIAAGTTFAEISGKKFGEVFIPIPPIEEQRRIVAKLEEVFAGVEKLGSLMEYA